MIRPGHEYQEDKEPCDRILGILTLLSELFGNEDQ